MFVLGFFQGTIRRLLGLASMLFSFLFAANLRAPLGDFLAANWNQFPDEYAVMLGFGIVFMAATIAFTLVIQGFYKHQPLFEKATFVDEIDRRPPRRPPGPVPDRLHHRRSSTRSSCCGSSRPATRSCRSCATSSASTTRRARPTCSGRADPGLLHVFGLLIPDAPEVVLHPPLTTRPESSGGPTLEAAAALIGARLVRDGTATAARVARIVELEAYIGADDRASHARFGRTAGTRSCTGRRAWPTCTLSTGCTTA